MRLPKLLVIGPMKSGSTTLCELLSRNASIEFSRIKEPHLLMHKNISDEGIVQAYSNLYGSSKKEKIFADGSTGYSKLPWCASLPEKAKRILGEEIHIVFIKRNRIDRCISHHKHLVRSDSTFPLKFEEAIERDKTIVRFSLYAPVFECWLRHFDRNHIHLIDFDLMISDPRMAIKPILKALELEDLKPENQITQIHANRGNDQRVAPYWMREFKGSVTRSRFYKTHLRWFIPDGMISFSKSLLYRPGKAESLKPQVATLSQLNAMFEEDEQQLARLIRG